MYPLPSWHDMSGRLVVALRGESQLNAAVGWATVVQKTRYLG